MNLLSAANSISIEHPKILTRHQLSVTMDSEWVEAAITSMIVLCTHNDGGVGKTTLALHVAGSLQTKLSRILLIDCDDGCDLYPIHPITPTFCRSVVVLGVCKAG